jgi:3-oxo-5-alpha-steroid 4-dehydrogenase 1
MAMNERVIYNDLILSWFIMGAIVFISLFFFTAPYGRHTRKGWGLAINDTLGWILMEAAAPLTFAVCFVISQRPVTPVMVIFLIFWEAHYIHRAFIYPFARRDKEQRMSLAIVFLGFIFNLVNGYLNGRFIFSFSTHYQNAWLYDPRFIFGLTILIIGFIINRQADTILKNLRKPGENDYKVPYGSLYAWISCPNYLGELLIWTGWAIATWSLPAFAFAFWTAANLVPRARTHHLWYKERFPEYPENRKALLPGLW